MRTFSRIVLAVIFAGVAYWMWTAYQNYELNRRVAPLRELIKKEMARFAAATKSGAKFEPSGCSKSCAQELLDSYVIESSGEVRMVLRGHPELSGRTLQYRPTIDKGAEGSPIFWTCQSNIAWPTLSLFPWCL